MTPVPTSPAYLTPVEADPIVAANLAASSHERTAWDALDETGKTRALSRSTSDIDAVRMRGVKCDPDQATQFPRVDHRSGLAVGQDRDEAAGDYTIFGVPREIRIATAIHAATLASRDAGTDPLSHVHRNAAAGISSASGRGGGEAYGASARTPWASLGDRVQPLLARFRRVGGRVV